MKKFIIFFTVLVLLVGCNAKPIKKYRIDGFAQGTTYRIIYLADEELVTRSDVTDVLNAFDKSCSLYDSTSLLCKINSGLTDSLDANIKECLTLAFRLSKESDGMYDVTVKPLVEAYGFAARSGDTLVNVDSLLQYVGYEKVSIDGNKLLKPKGFQIDLNSIAQGFSVDLMARKFDKLKIKNYLIEIGGEVFARGKNDKDKEWNVGIDKPFDGNMSPGANLQTVISLSGKGLGTSGNYRKFHTDKDGHRINHTINPKTGESVVTNLLSATIVAPSAIEADAYATVMMALGTEKAIEFLKQHSELGAYLVYSEGEKNIVYEQ
ncbi:MAG: FAD:protein FMN transferase [Rikenellaceae bacterium]